MKGIKALALAACAVGCFAPSDAVPQSTWRGSIQTEGNSTHVKNEAGSVWGGSARLIEEISIGMDNGPEPYLFGRVSSIWATEERIYVLDYQVPAIRAFDHEGEYVGDLGRRGQGPGEVERPDVLLAGPSEAIIIRDIARGAFLLWTRTGREIDRWPFGGGPRIFSAGLGVQITNDGEVWMSEPPDGDENGRRRTALVMRRYGSTGVNEVREVPLPVESSDADGLGPFRQRAQWIMTSSGDLVVGHTATYTFTIHHRDGTRTVVQRDVEPVPLLREEAAWFVADRVRQGRARDPRFFLDVPIPDHKPAYSFFLSDRTDRIWVVRHGPSQTVRPCDRDPHSVPLGQIARSCWQTALTADVFAADGRFLGSIENFAGGLWRATPWFSWKPSFIDGENAYFAVEDDQGTIMVKKYRIAR